MITNSNRILASWRNHFSELLNVLGDNDIRQTKIRTGESLVSELSDFNFEMAIEKFNDTNHHVLIKSRQN